MTTTTDPSSRVTRDEVVRPTYDVLRSAPRDDKRGSAWLTAYQIFRALPEPLRQRLFDDRGTPGEGQDYGPPSLVSTAASFLEGLRVAQIEKLDTRHMLFDMSVPSGALAMKPASGKVVALFRWTGEGLDDALAAKGITLP